MLTSAHVREACELLRWSRYDLQRRTALPLYVVDQVMVSDEAIKANLARTIVLKDALYRAGIDLTPEGLRFRADRS